MSVELNDITSGYSTGLINSNFQYLEDYINNNLLNKNGTETGEPNQMELDLDMNSHSIYNVLTDLTNPRSLINLEDGDSRYLNVSGDTMEGSLTMSGYPITVRVAIADNEPARKDELDKERVERKASDVSINNRITQEVDQVKTDYQAADANLQSQISGGDPLEASAFSEISWHGQVVENSVTIPDNKNGWSFGPTMSVAAGQSVTIGTGSYWTIANGDVV